MSLYHSNDKGFCNYWLSKQMCTVHWPVLETHINMDIQSGCSGRDRMVAGFTTTCAIIVYHHWSCEFKPRSWWGVLNIILFDKACQWLATSLRFSPGSCTMVSSTNKIDRHDITEILLKVALNTIKQTKINIYNWITIMLKIKYNSISVPGS